MEVILTDDELRDGLTACLAVPRWVDELLRGAPYDSLDGLLAAARRAAEPLTAVEVDQALADHPRIGERHPGTGRAAAFSLAERAGTVEPDADLGQALAAGNRAYEEEFGRVFVVRAAGRSRREMLAELERRLRLDAEAELAEAAGALREIALLRIPQLLSAPGSPLGL